MVSTATSLSMILPRAVKIVVNKIDIQRTRYHFSQTWLIIIGSRNTLHNLFWRHHQKASRASESHSRRSIRVYLPRSFEIFEIHTKITALVAPGVYCYSSQNSPISVTIKFISWCIKVCLFRIQCWSLCKLPLPRTFAEFNAGKCCVEIPMYHCVIAGELTNQSWYLTAQHLRLYEAP